MPKFVISHFLSGMESLGGQEEIDPVLGIG